MILVLATLGFTSVIGQVVLMRELIAVLYGNELVFGLILAWWLLWEAVGAWGFGKFAIQRSWGQRALAAALILGAVALPLQIALARAIRDLMGVTPGAFFPLEQILLAVGLILAPYGLVHGLAFSLGARLLGADSAGRAYAYESIGAVGGGAVFSFFLINHLDPFQTTLMLIAVALAVILRFRWRADGSPSRLLGLLAVGGIVALPLGAKLHRTTLARQWPRLVFADDSRYGRLTITALGGQRAFFENGLLAFETESTFPEEVVHLPMLAHPRPRRVLLIGGGIAGDLTEILKHDVAEITYLELDPLVIKAAQSHLPAEEAAVLEDPRLSLILEDGRHYTKRSQVRFDVIIVDLPEPSTGQLNRFYTLEFFRELMNVLAEDGVLSLGLLSAENYWTPELARRNASVYHTLRQVFPTLLVTPGDHNFFLATPGVSFPDATTLGERLIQRGITTRWMTPQYIQFLLTGDRSQTILADLERREDVKLNRDLVPICYFYDLALWVSRFGSGLRGAFETTSLLRLGWLVPVLGIALLVLRGRRSAVGLALVGSTGFAGMTLQIVLLLTFQALYGYVYHQVGLLVTAFMAGLAVGAGLSSRLGRTARRQGQQATARAMFWVQLGLGAYAVALAALLPLRLPAPGITYALLAAVAGGLTGSVFPLAASLSSPNDTSRVAGLLYAADLTGGCLGAVTASILLVPVLGVVQTCLAVALLAGTGTLITLYRSFTNPC